MENPRRLILHLDVNKTIVMSDRAYGETSDFAVVFTVVKSDLSQTYLG